MTYEQMRSVDISTISPDEVTDAADIVIDINLPVSERIKSYERQTKNMYFMKVGNIIVKTLHANTTQTADDCVERLLRAY